MGIFEVTIAVANVHGEVYEEVEANVDTGSAVSEFADGWRLDSDTGWRETRSTPG